MGAFLEKPKTEKATASGTGYGDLRYGMSAMQGWRMEMEDAHICATEIKELKDYGFFGVFDGHAGPKAAAYCSEKLLENIMRCYKEKKEVEQEVDRMKDAIREGFLQTDDALRREPAWATGQDHSGTTAVCVMISPTHIYWANCGDSRALLCRSNKVEFSTTDHKPFNVSEKERIEKAGGTVMMQRVNGTLAVSRALGDFDYKRNSDINPVEQLVSPEPDIYVMEREGKNDEFILLACDGIYDVMNNEDVLEYVRHRLEITEKLEDICSELIDSCLHKNSRDNMSVILITFPGAPKVTQEAIEKHKELQEEASAKIKERLKDIVKMAHDPLEVEENYVVQQLTMEMPSNYDVVGKRPFISEHLQELTKEKFGSSDGSNDFPGPSDSGVAPSELRLYPGGQEMVIRNVMTHDTESAEEFHSYDQNLLMNIAQNVGDEEPPFQGTSGTQDGPSHEEDMETEDSSERNPGQQPDSIAT